MTTYAQASAEYLDRLRVKGYAVLSVRVRARRLATFGRFLAAAGIVDLAGITGDAVRSYIRHLQETPIRLGRGCREKRRRQADYIRKELLGIALLFRELAARKEIPADPFAGVELPPWTLQLPRNAPTEEEAARLLASPATDEPQGVRDRALLELVYSVGLRPLELVALDVVDLDLAGGRVTVRGAGPRPERTVALGEAAVFWLGRYLTEVRPVQLRESRERALFLNYSGERLERNGVAGVVRRAVRRAGLGRGNGWQTLRQRCGLRRLRAGAAEAEVRELLYHSSQRRRGR